MTFKRQIIESWETLPGEKKNIHGGNKNSGIYRQIAEEVGCTYQYVKEVMCEYRGSALVKKDRKFKDSVVSLDVFTPDEYEKELLDADSQKERYKNSFGDKSKPLEIELEPVNGYGRLIPTADWHAGSMFCDHKALLKFIKFIKKSKTKMIGLGDYTENFFYGFGKNMLPCLIQSKDVKTQAKIALSILNDLGNRGLIAGMVTGNHDVRDENLTGKSILDYIKFPFDVRRNRTIAHIKCGKAEYKILVAHRLTGNSQWNPVHANVKSLKMDGYYDCDAIIAGHTHEPSLQYLPFRNTFVPLIKVGTFNYDSQYGRENFGTGTSFIYCPIMLFSEKKEPDFPIVLPGFMSDKIITPRVTKVR
jgi:predicted phosphodiesterase